MSGSACAQSCPHQPAWHLQKPSQQSPRPLHWLAHTISVASSHVRPAWPSSRHGHLRSARAADGRPCQVPPGTGPCLAQCIEHWLAVAALLLQGDCACSPAETHTGDRVPTPGLTSCWASRPRTSLWGHTAGPAPPLPRWWASRDRPAQLELVGRSLTEALVGSAGLCSSGLMARVMAHVQTCSCT